MIPSQKVFSLMLYIGFLISVDIILVPRDFSKAITLSLVDDTELTTGCVVIKISYCDEYSPCSHAYRERSFGSSF